METKTTPVWQNKKLDELYKLLSSSVSGLANSEVKNRQVKFGLNKITEAKKRSWLIILLFQFKSPLVYILLIAAVLTYYLNHTIDAYVIIFVVFLNAFFGLFYELKADKAVEALKNILALKAKVKRDGNWLDLNIEQLVPGDIVEIQSGMKIPADIRIIKSHNMRTDEAILTGESVLQDKSDIEETKSQNIGDQPNMLFSGTIVVSGRGLGLVVSTGKETQFGQIAQEITQTEKEETPLQKKLNKFSKSLVILVVILVVAIFFIGILQGLDLIQMFLVSLSIAISVIPEGLPAIITITLATGAYRMSRRKAIIRKLAAVETLGSVNVIASDKTGTLTHNQMMIEKIYTHSDKQIYTVTGSGYEPKGEFKPNLSKDTVQLLTFGLLCSDAEIFEEKDEWQVSGDSTEGAIVATAQKAGQNRDNLFESYPRLDEIPFETENGYMAVLNNIKGVNTLIVKGKLEKLIEISNLSETEKKQIISESEKMGQAALRVIAFAYKELKDEQKDISHKDLSGLKFLGLAGMIDPPRREAIETIKICNEAGLRTIMITGDYGLTASAIAQQLGIVPGRIEVCTGEEVGRMDEQQLQAKVSACSVFARISPDQKLKIVSSLQKLGKIVAVTGDGINDAPALKKSDVGVAMGEGGTDVSREVADLVLSDNNYVTIIVAIEEGRTVYQNIRRGIFYLLSTNVGELMIMMTSLIMFREPYNLPLIPVQILWLNLVTDGTAGLALALEPVHKGTINQKPRSQEENIMSKVMLVRIMLVALTMLAITFFVYSREIASGASIERARTMAFVVMCLLQITNLFNSRSFKNSIFKTNPFSNKYVILSFLVSLILTYLTVGTSILRQFFHTVILSTADWLYLLGLSVIIIIVIEIEKFIRKNKNTVY